MMQLRLPSNYICGQNLLI